MLLKGEGSPLCDKESRGNSAMKTNGAAYILWLLGLVGFCGIQRIYTGNYISGVIWFLTPGTAFHWADNRSFLDTNISPRK